MGEIRLTINESNQVLIESADMKACLHKHNFYTENILNEICSNIQQSSGIGSYVSSYVIYPGEVSPAIRLNMRKAFFKRFKDEKNNSIEFYTHINNAIRQCYVNNFLQIKEIVPNSPRLLLDIPLMYEIDRIDENVIFIKL